jgi:hypothetical protein
MSINLAQIPRNVLRRMARTQGRSEVRCMSLYKYQDGFAVARSGGSFWTYAQRPFPRCARRVLAHRHQRLERVGTKTPRAKRVRESGREEIGREQVVGCPPSHVHKDPSLAALVGSLHTGLELDGIRFFLLRSTGCS